MRVLISIFSYIAYVLLFIIFAVVRDGDSFQLPELYDFDHVYPYSSIESPIAILYGALETDCFKEFHVALAEAAKEVYYLHWNVMCEFVYIF